MVATTWTKRSGPNGTLHETINNRLFILVTEGIERIGFPDFLQIPFLYKLARAELCCLQIITVYNPVIYF